MENGRKSRLVCGAILKALKKEKVYNSSSDQIRDYLNIDDVVEAILLSSSVNKNLILNICSNKVKKLIH